MSTIEEIMEAVYRSQFAASAYEASSGPGTGKLEVDMFAADGEVRAMITEAIAEARREGAEAMRESAVKRVIADRWMDDLDAAETIGALPLPTSKRQAVRLTAAEIAKAMLSEAPDEFRSHGDEEELAANPGYVAIGRAIESAVLAANGLGDGASCQGRSNG